MRRDLLGGLAAGLVVVLFCLVLLWRDPLVFWNDDYQISILPVFADVARSWSEGHLPLLTPYSWICGNLAGEFQYGTFSVFVNAAVVLIWKFPLTFAQQAAALSITHLFVLAMGGYLLGREYKLRPPFASIVAVVAALNGWIICWGAIDWFGALGAFAWLPWAWWGMERAVDSRRGKWRWIWPAPFVYLVITGGFPYTVLMLGLIVAWIALRQLVRSGQPLSILPLFLGVALGIGMSSPAWLALLEYVRGSARETQDPSAHWQWRVPLAALPAFLLPNWTVNWVDFSSRLMPHGTTELACGLVPPVALLSAFYSLGREFLRRIGWEFALLLLVLVATMLPTAGVFRWSFRWLPLLHVVLAVCAGVALQEMSSRKWSVVLPLCATLLIAVAGAMMWFLRAGGPYAFPMLAALATIVAVWWLLAFVPSELSRWVPVATTTSVLLATYLIIPANCGVPKYGFTEQLLEPSPLSRERLYLSFYPQPETAYRSDKNAGPVGQIVRPGSTSMWAGVRLINGYSPIRPAGVARVLYSGIHGELDFGTTELALWQHADRGGEMAKLGIDGVIIARDFNIQPLPLTEWQEVHSSTEGVVYHRAGEPLASVRAFWDPQLSESAHPIHILHESRNRVVAHYAGNPEDELSVFVAFSRPYFPGYIAMAHGKALPVSSYRGLIPMVELPSGFTGEFTLSYRPAWLVWGGVAAGLCLAVTLAGFVSELVRASKRPACNAYPP